VSGKSGGTWDVAVVGTGPAGAAAARAAATAGARTLLLERAQLPRYKRCGGGLVGASQAAVRATGVDLPALSRDLVGRLTFSWDGQRAFTRSAPAFLPMVLRSELDAALVAAAVDAGAVLREGVTVTSYAQSRGLVTLGTSAGEVRAHTVVGADGAQGRAAAHVGVVVEQVDLGLEAELPTPPRADWDGRVLLDWGPVPGSYGWVFPKGATLTVGVIGARASGPQVRAYYAAFLARLGLDPTTALHDGGHLTRVRAPGSPLRRGRVLVAGDAAGLLEPWTREGISFALRSGALAGQAAVGDVGAYPQAVTRALGPEMAAGRRALHVFTRHPGTVHTVLRALPRARRDGSDRERYPVFDLFVRLVSGETDVAAQLDRRRVQLAVGLLERV
jgi:geranylgeranyl reductase family protein